MIKKDDLIIRTIKEEDLQLLDKWETPEIRGDYQEFNFKSIVDLENKYKENGFISDKLQALIVESKSDGPVGLLFINFLREGIVNLGLVITEVKKRNTGLGKKTLNIIIDHLFDNYPLVRIEADTDVKNKGAQKVLEQVGLKQEGRLRNYRYYNSKWNDSYIYSMTKSDYLKLKED